MNVGIFTPYQARDVTYAALQVADLARGCGNEVSVYTLTPRRGPVHARWDDRVARTPRFTEWAEPLDALVWAECPPADAVRWAARPRRRRPPRRLVLISSWDDTLDQVRTVYPLFTHVVAPSGAAAGFLTNEGLANVREVRWSPRLPIVLADPAPGGAPPRLHFPLCDAQGREHDPAAVDLIERLLRHDAAADIHVTLKGRSGEVVRRLGRRAESHPRLTVGRCTDYESYVLVLGDHDLTVLTSTAESFGMTALCSLHLGTPVMAFDAVPLDEIVGRRNGILVPGAVTNMVPGTAANDERDQDKFMTTLLRTLDDPGLITSLRLTCAAGLDERARAFEQAWGQILYEA